MKRLFLSLVLVLFMTVGVAKAATYYMRGDGTALNKGAATGDCSAASSCMDISVHNGETFTNGDIIAVCDTGGIIYGGLNARADGVTYQAEGTPVISASHLFPGSLYSWSDLGSNQWVQATKIVPSKVFFDGVEGVYASPPTQPLQWAWNAGYLYVYSEGDPGVVYTSPGITETFNAAIYTAGFDSLVFDGFAVCEAEYCNIWIYNGSSDITVQNCTVYDSKGTGIKIETVGNSNNNLITGNIVAGNGFVGIESHESNASIGHETVISNNTIYDNGSDGIRVVSSYHIMSDNTIYNNGLDDIDGCSAIHLVCANDDNYADHNIVKNNTISSQHGWATDACGIIVDHYADHNIVYGNIVSSCEGPCIMIFKSQDNELYNNTCYNNAQGVSPDGCPHAEIVLWGDADVDRIENITIKNNIIYATDADYAIRIGYYTADNTGLLFSHNHWYKSSGDWFLKGILDPGSDVGIWNAYDIVGTDFFSDPLLDKNSLKLRSRSPCIDAGLDVSLVHDRSGYRIPNGSGPDIGAFEYYRKSYGSMHRSVAKKTSGCILSVEESGLVNLDSTAAAMTIYLPPLELSWGVPFFLHKDNAGNNITISANEDGKTIGGAASKTLTNQYDTLQVWGGTDQWYCQ